MQFKPGKKLKIIGFDAQIEKTFLKKLLALGIRKNAICTIQQVSPFNGPIQILLGSLNIGLRVSELAKFQFEIIE